MANLNQPQSRVTPNLLHILNAFTDSSNTKIDLTKIYNEADKFVRKIVIPINKEAKNILLWRPSDIRKIETIATGGGNWI